MYGFWKIKNKQGLEKYILNEFWKDNLSKITNIKRKQNSNNQNFTKEEYWNMKVLG